MITYRATGGKRETSEAFIVFSPWCIVVIVENSAIRGTRSYPDAFAFSDLFVPCMQKLPNVLWIALNDTVLAMTYITYISQSLFTISSKHGTCTLCGAFSTVVCRLRTTLLSSSWKRRSASKDKTQLETMLTGVSMERFV